MRQKARQKASEEMSDQLRNEAILGEEAQQLLDNKVYKQAIAAVEDGLIRAIKQSALGDESTHHRLAISLQLLGQITKHIETAVQTGKMAEFQLKKESVGSRLKRASGF